MGRGSEFAKLEAEKASRDLNNVLFFGEIDSSEIPGLLASMDAAVAPYPPGANFYFSPLKVYEYMAAGLPVAASRVGQLENIIDDKANGLLVTAGDAGALADTLENLAGDARLRTNLGVAARATVIEKHTWEAVARRIFAIVNLDGGAAISRGQSRHSAEVAK